MQEQDKRELRRAWKQLKEAWRQCCSALYSVSPFLAAIFVAGFLLGRCSMVS